MRMNLSGSLLLGGAFFVFATYVIGLSILIRALGIGGGILIASALIAYAASRTQRPHATTEGIQSQPGDPPPPVRGDEGE